MDILAILPNLSIGVVAVVSLVYITREFIKHLKEVHEQHLQELHARENEIRAVEKEVRTSISSQLADNTHLMERVMRYLDQ